MSFSFNKSAATSDVATVEATEVATPETNNPAITSGEVVNDASEGETAKAKAVAFASRESTEMGEVMNLVMKAKEDWQGGPIKVLFAMMQTYGDDLREFPIPDDETSNNPDKFKIAVTGNDGKVTLRQTSFYAEFADATREGAAIVERLGWVKRAGNNEAVKDGIPSDILEMNPAERDRHEAFLKGRRATIRGSYKKAMALGFQLEAVCGMPGMVAEIVMEEDGSVANTTKPIIVYQVPAAGKPATKFEHFSIGAFTKLNVNKALEKGGNLAALKGTVSRNTNGGATGNDGKAANTPAIKTVETFIERFVEVYRFMDEMQMDKSQKMIGQFYKFLKDKAADELVVGVVEYRNYLDDVCKELGLDKRYTAIQAKSPELTTTKAA